MPGPLVQELFIVFPRSYSSLALNLHKGLLLGDKHVSFCRESDGLVSMPLPCTTHPWCLASHPAQAHPVVLPFSPIHNRFHNPTEPRLLLRSRRFVGFTSQHFRIDFHGPQRTNLDFGGNGRDDALAVETVTTNTNAMPLEEIDANSIHGQGKEMEKVQNPRQLGADGGEPDEVDRPGAVVAEKGVEEGQTSQLGCKHKQGEENEQRPVEKQVYVAKRKRVPALRQGCRELQEDMKEFMAHLEQFTKLVRSALVLGVETSAEHQWVREYKLWKLHPDRFSDPGPREARIDRAVRKLLKHEVDEGA